MKNTLKNRTVWYITAIVITIDLVYGVMKSPFLLHFTNALTFTSYIVLLVGIARWGWIKGDFASSRWNPDKHGSYVRYRNELIKGRETSTNPLLTSGIILWLLQWLFTFIYM